MTRSLTHSPISVLPISFGTGFIGKSISAIANVAAGGTVALTGYAVSGAIVDYMVGTRVFLANPVDAGGNRVEVGYFRAKLGRPLAFFGLAGLIGAGVAWLGGIFRLKNRALLAALAASGSAIRGVGSLIDNFTTAPAGGGFIADMRASAVGLAGGFSDFLQARQLADYFQAPQGMSGCDPDFDLDDGVEGGDANAMADAGLDEEGGDGFDVM